MPQKCCLRSIPYGIKAPGWHSNPASAWDWQRPRLCSLHRQENHVSDRVTHRRRCCSSIEPNCSRDWSLLAHLTFTRIRTAHRGAMPPPSPADHPWRPKLGELAFRVSIDRIQPARPGATDERDRFESIIMNRTRIHTCAPRLSGISPVVYHKSPPPSSPDRAEA